MLGDGTDVMVALPGGAGYPRMIALARAAGVEVIVIH
jgi:hypothetical protein